MHCLKNTHKYVSNSTIIVSPETRVKLVEAQSKHQDKHVRICLACNELDFESINSSDHGQHDKMMRSHDVVNK